MLEEAIEYFKINPGYLRLFKGIKNKYISYGEMKGNVVINNPSFQEREALSGLMKKDYSRNKSISINISKVQEKLDNTRFAGIDLKDLIDNFFKEEILSKTENKHKYEVELTNFFNEILSEYRDTFVYKFFSEIIESKNNVYYNLKKYYNKDKVSLKEALESVCKGINNLPKENIRIPVFASNVINNPHGFDRKNLAGKIFILFLSYINNIPFPRNSEELSELYYKNHLLIDDVSNMVLCKNILGFVEERDCYGTENKAIQGDKSKFKPVYSKHDGLAGFWKYNEPLYLTIYNLSNISFIKKSEKFEKVLVVENPAVFMEVVEKCEDKNLPLVCTYGQVKLAAIILLDLLVEAGYGLVYSGDIDPEGIQIADKLKQRYGDNLEFIGFDEETYFRNMSDIKVSEERIHKLKQIKSEELKKVCECVGQYKKVAYEEENIGELIKVRHFQWI